MESKKSVPTLFGRPKSDRTVRCPKKATFFSALVQITSGIQFQGMQFASFI